MNCPVCDDPMMVSEVRCTFCGYDFNTNKRGRVDAPPEGAAATARRQGMLQIAGGAVGILAGAVAVLLPGRFVGIFVMSASGGVLGRGMYLVSQARRWDLKQRLYDEQQAAQLASTSEGGASVAIPSSLR